MNVAKLVKYPRRIFHFLVKGCGFWKAEVNKPNCSFPDCWCYPEWSWKKKKK